VVSAMVLEIADHATCDIRAIVSTDKLEHLSPVVTVTDLMPSRFFLTALSSHAVMRPSIPCPAGSDVIRFRYTEMQRRGCSGLGQRRRLSMWTIFEVLPFFDELHHPERTHEWLSQSQGSTYPGAALASVVAIRMVAWWCRSRPDRLDAWYSRHEGGPAPVGTIRESLEVVLRSTVGLPGSPRPVDHLEAVVAEHLWFFLTQDCSQRDSVAVIEGPSPEVTEIGGDGLVVHRLGDGNLMFRLWEIKKHTGESPVSQTVGRAYGQLSANAARYLNKVSLNGQYANAPDLARFYGRLMDEWIEATAAASAGVSVALSTPSLPKKAFTTFPRRFPRFLVPPRLRGQLSAVDDFKAFAKAVRDEIWKGL
jgi:hypothetical protein